MKFRKPDIITLLAVSVCLGVVVTTAAQGAEPSSSWARLAFMNRPDCPSLDTDWQVCPRRYTGGWQASNYHLNAVELRTSQYPAFGLTWYQGTPNARIHDPAALPSDWEVAGSLAGMQFTGSAATDFGVAVSRYSDGLGLQLGVASDYSYGDHPRPLFYFSIHNAW